MELKTFYRRNLPHFQPNDNPYFITFRLADSLPLAVHRDRALKPTDKSNDMTFAEFDRNLDRGHGPVWLAQPSIANVVKESLHYRDGKIFELFVYTIMPNHVHLVISLKEQINLHEVLHSLKRHTARDCNKLLNRTGAFWQHESYDHVIRDGEFGRIVFYVLRNPVKAGLCKKFSDWPYSYVSPELDGFDENELFQRGKILL